MGRRLVIVLYFCEHLAVIHHVRSCAPEMPAEHDIYVPSADTSLETKNVRVFIFFL